MCDTAVIIGKELSKYSFGEKHPLNSGRLDAFWSKIGQLDSIDTGNLKLLSPALANERIVSSFHDKNYINFVKKSSITGSGYLDSGDTPSFIGVFEASLYVIGSTLLALDTVINKTNGIVHAFNPIGGLHHARRNAAGGFCVFNDIGIAIMYARKRYNIKKILYVDIDAHHGDGVYYEFEQDPDVILADIHEDGSFLYPGTGFESEKGLGPGKGTKLNLALHPGATDRDFLSAFMKIENFIDSMKFELIIFQCGADGLLGDPLTHLRYSEKSHEYAAQVLHRFAHERSHGRIIGLGGGGYNTQNLANAWNKVVEVFVSNHSIIKM
ncbi:MAG TPA: acetoin utilization protein AcuC [Nitrososphaeraceae archaeon]|jgi:acetoin utilization protein AcuC|nr:acetoin utilization protein AcuC [Nitrososphaeraceae archaeon]